jgi:hypothetical protein
MWISSEALVESNECVPCRKGHNYRGFLPVEDVNAPYLLMNVKPGFDVIVACCEEVGG